MEAPALFPGVAGTAKRGHGRLHATSWVSPDLEKCRSRQPLPLSRSDRAHLADDALRQRFERDGMTRPQAGRGYPKLIGR